MTDIDTDSTVTELLLRWEESFENGNEISVSELCRDFPSLIAEVEPKVNALKKMGWMTKESDELEPESNELVGLTLNDRYQIESVIGSGGYGVVYKALDRELERFVAIKVPHKHRIADHKLDEAKVAAKFQTDGIVTVHDVGIHESLPYIVSEFIDGQSLREYAAINELTLKQIVHIVAEIAMNLQKAHDAGWVHRDIKPENILIDANGNPHIADFGVTTQTEDRSELHRGTMAYMAPEQIAGEKQLVDQRCDIYSLGVVIFELICGKLPHIEQSSGKLRENILLAEPDFEQIQPESMRLVCRQSLAKHPDARFQSAASFASSLRESLLHLRPTSSGWLKYIWLGLATALLLAVAGKIWDSVDRKCLERGTLFDGTNRIVTDVDSFGPCTVEAWIVPNSHSKQQWIVGSDRPGQFGIGIGIKNGHPMIETIRGGMHAPDTKIPLDQWSHLAGVFGANETRMYLNGKLVGTCPPTEAPMEASKFVIGNLGEKHQTQYFTGRIRSVRISKGERFSDTFTPKEFLDEDDSTVVSF